MDSQRILVAGCGKIGLQVASSLAVQHQVWGLKRDPTTLPEYISGIASDLTRDAYLAEKLPDGIDYIVYCLTPNSMTDEGYRDIYVNGLTRLLTALQVQQHDQQIKQLFFVSSTSVYHQNNDEWVDEDSETLPQRFSGQRLLQGEQLALQSPYAASIIRFSGIYGQKRNRLISHIQSGSADFNELSPYTNRIHEIDAVGFLLHLIEKKMAGNDLEEVYLATDSCPVRAGEVNRYIASLLGVIPGTGPQDNTATTLRRGGSKRCRNQRLLDSGYRLQFPSYREGYEEITRNN